MLLYPDTEVSLSEAYPGTGFFGVFEHDIHNLRRGTLVQYERLGFRMPEAAEAFRPGWGVDTAARDLDILDQYSQPFAASEIIRKFSVQRCVQVQSAQIVPAGIAFELVHWTIPAGSVGVIESIPVIWSDVTALDQNAVPVFTYAGLNGEDLCLDELVHPDPLVLENLTWRFHLTYTDSPSRDLPSAVSPLTYRAAIPPDHIGGQNILPPWSDARYGHAEQWGQFEQYLFPSSTVIRYWIVLFGPTGRFRVRVGARLGGFWQLGGRRGSALESVLTRRI